METDPNKIKESLRRIVDLIFVCGGIYENSKGELSLVSIAEEDLAFEYINACNILGVDVRITTESEDNY